MGATALHFATVNQLIKNVQALIKLGADVDKQDADGNGAEAKHGSGCEDVEFEECVDAEVQVS